MGKQKKEDKKLNLFDLTSIGVGCIIGSGVFSLMGFGIAYTGRGIVIALFLAMGLVVIQAVRLPILTRVFELDGGIYSINSLICPKFCAGFDVATDIVFRAGTLAVTALAVTQYLAMLFPAVASFSRIAALVVLTLAFLCVLPGDRFASRIQNVMCIFMYVALAAFVVFGLIHMDPSSYSGEPMMINGFTGLMMATALMTYTCNGFQYVINMGKSAKKPRRDLPLAFLLSALCGAAIYALIGFAATHSHSYSTISGMNLGGIAELIMPNAVYLFFIIGGALFALCTSLVGAVISSYKPMIASANDGWLPHSFAKRTKNGAPYVLLFVYLLGAVPILLNLNLGDVATMCLIPKGLNYIFTDIFSMTAPQRFAKQWKASGIHISGILYRFLLCLSIVASVIIVVYCFLSNNLKIPMVILTIVTFGYGFLRSRFGKITIEAKNEYQEDAQQ